MVLRVEYLPPANEAWGKVIFSQACVKNSVHRGGSGPGKCLVQGGSARGGLVQGVPGLKGGGVCSGGYLLWGECLVETPRGTATAAGGTHPTGMHSCR